MITVFTPTYNRGYIIENLYQSLRRQTSKEFEWIVIDDGSTDDTESLIYRWKDEVKDFSIKYKKIENGGKHRAINMGVAMASTDNFFIVDSDDYLVDDAIEEVQKWLRTISGDSGFAGISGFKGYTPGIPVGGCGTFENDYVDATNLEREKYGLTGDKAEVYKTSILKKYPFPEFEKEKFLTEAIVWNKIAQDGYKIRWFKKIIYICDYLEDGLTRCGYMRSIKNPEGYMAYLNLMTDIYGKEYGKKQKFGFYFVLRGYGFNVYACKEKMHLTFFEASYFEEEYKKMIKDMNVFFSTHNVKNIAIYGLGNVGNAFLTIINQLEISLDYAIDKGEVKKAKIPCYTPDKENLPNVDMIVITLKNYNKSIEKEMCKKFDEVVYWKDISRKYWVI